MISKYWKSIKLFLFIQIIIFVYFNLIKLQESLIDDLINVETTTPVVLKLDNSLAKFIENANLMQHIRNKYFINKLLKNENKTFLVILIQVSSRLNYLKELIQSLKNTRYINETLVVFSHDFIDNQINSV